MSNEPMSKLTDITKFQSKQEKNTNTANNKKYQ